MLSYVEHFDFDPPSADPGRGPAAGRGAGQPTPEAVRRHGGPGRPALGGGHAVVHLQRGGPVGVRQDPRRSPGRPDGRRPPLAAEHAGRGRETAARTGRPETPRPQMTGETRTLAGPSGPLLRIAAT